MGSIKEIDNFLHENEAVCLWSGKVHGHTLEMHMVKCKIFIVQYLCKGGWNIFIPVTESNRIDVTLESLREYLNKQ